MSDNNIRSRLPALQLRISGAWAHFKKPETNNNPLTHDFITKTALLGLMGAVLGVERLKMREEFPVWSDDLRYGVQVLRNVRKVSWQFTMRGVKNNNERSPRPMEVLRHPEFLVTIASRKERSDELLEKFTTYIEHSRAIYPPVLGLHNCPAQLEFVQRCELSAQNGAYSTHGFARLSDAPQVDFTSRDHEFRLGFERIPTFQNNDFWNPPDKYIEVCYADGGEKIDLEKGEHFQLPNGDCWCLV